MADSERMRGNRSPVTDYKIGNGGIRDLFKYILGDDKTRNSMKIVKTRSGKSTIIKNKAQKNAVVNTVKKVMVNDSNAVSAMAGDRARNIQRNMAANMNQRVEPARVTGEDQTNRMRMMATYPNVVQDDRGPTAIVEPVVVENLPEAPMMSNRPSLLISRNSILNPFVLGPYTPMACSSKLRLFGSMFSNRIILFSPLLPTMMSRSPS